MTSSPRETELCRYHYDPLDRLISHALPNTPGRQRFYCKSRLATEIQGAMRFSIVQQGNQLLAQQRSEGDAPDTTLLATDQQRSVLQTLKANHPPQPIAYSPNGHRPVASWLLSLLGFNGERPDPVTGHYLLGNGYRAFNPVLIRFNSPDSLSPFGKGGLNAYAYCLGDPVNWDDHTGRSPLLRLFMEFAESSNMAPTKRILGPKASTQLAEWRMPAREVINKPPTRELSSLTAISMDPLQPNQVLPHAKTSARLRGILNTTDPFNFKTYEDIRHAQNNDGFFLNSNQNSEFSAWNAIYKAQYFARNTNIMTELLNHQLKAQKIKSTLTPSLVKSLNKEIESIRLNFQVLPNDY